MSQQWDLIGSIPGDCMGETPRAPSRMPSKEREKQTPERERLRRQKRQNWKYLQRSEYEDGGERENAGRPSRRW